MLEVGSPLLLKAKLISRNIRERKIPRDNELPEDLKKQLEKWFKQLTYSDTKKHSTEKRRTKIHTAS